MPLAPHCRLKASTVAASGNGCSCRALCDITWPPRSAGRSTPADDALGRPWGRLPASRPPWARWSGPT
eukprot:1075635-Alexandrium_andersonii.AAC.1